MRKLASARFGALVVLALALICIRSDVRAQLPRLILNEVTADFSVGADYPLIKSKFNVYDAIIPTMQQFDSNIDKLAELNIDTYRIELGWGRRSTGVGTHKGVGGTADNLSYDFAPLDNIVRQLHKYDMRLLGSYGYTPAPLQDPAVERNRDVKPPKDIARWKEVITAFAKHYREIGIPFGINEIWNEPDGLVSFFSGTEAEYQQMYIAAVEAIRAVDPDAVIGGPASAPELVWHRSFPEFVAKNRLPLDVFTFHHYGSGELARRDIAKVVDSLNRFPYFQTTSMNLDEWHDADCCNWCWDDVRHHYQGASQLLHDFKILLEIPELTQVSWAWWQDPGPRPPRAGEPGRAPGAGEPSRAPQAGAPSGAPQAGAQNRQNRSAGCMGLITGDGRRKAVFNAWKLFAGMPVDRKQVTVHGPLEALASAEAHKAALLVWNRDPYDRRFDANLKNLPFAKGNVRIYRIDRQHASAVDGAEELLAPVETKTNVDTTNWSWIGQVPANGTVYFEVDDGSGISELSPVSVAKALRVNHYYPGRGKTKSYADFDRKTWIARLGMAGERQADEQVSVLAEGLPEALEVTAAVEGKLVKQAANVLGVRVDYVVDGSYAKAAFFHGPYRGTDLYDRTARAASPWGTKRPAETVVPVPNLARFRMDLKANSPAGWSGKALLTFVMRNAGPEARAKFTVRRA